MSKPGLMFDVGEAEQPGRLLLIDVDAEDARNPERSWHKASIASMRYLKRMRTMLDDRQLRHVA